MALSKQLFLTTSREFRVSFAGRGHCSGRYDYSAQVYRALPGAIRLNLVIYSPVYFPRAANTLARARPINHWRKSPAGSAISAGRYSPKIASEIANNFCTPRVVRRLRRHRKSRLRLIFNEALPPMNKPRSTLWFSFNSSNSEPAKKLVPSAAHSSEIAYFSYLNIHGRLVYREHDNSRFNFLFGYQIWQRVRAGFYIVCAKFSFFSVLDLLFMFYELCAKFLSYKADSKFDLFSK